MQRLKLEEIKQIELKILISFHNFCEKNKLIYFISYGTLLGAKRHGGFIPWDDDIDVSMPRPDFERFVALTTSSPITPEYETCFYRDTKITIPYPFVKIIDTKTKVIEKTKSEEYCMGIWIDVFPLDGFSNNMFINKLFFFRKQFWKRLCYTYSDDLSKVTDKKKKIGKMIVMPFIKAMGLQRLFSKLEKICLKYKYEKSTYIGCTIWGDSIVELMNKSLVEPTNKILFEGIEFNAPADVPAYLTKLYGNYMQLPPENERINHEMLAYRL
ncbi:MAG: LicD family protein [Treponema sp.]|nr:LicD family protein [Treponema sp.]